MHFQLVRIHGLTLKLCQHILISFYLRTVYMFLNSKTLFEESILLKPFYKILPSNRRKKKQKEEFYNLEQISNPITDTTFFQSVLVHTVCWYRYHVPSIMNDSLGNISLTNSSISSRALILIFLIFFLMHLILMLLL